MKHQIMGVIPRSEVELTFGRGFRNVDVIDFEINQDGVWITRVLMLSQVFALIGDPEENLRRITEACIGGHA